MRGTEILNATMTSPLGNTRSSGTVVSRPTNATTFAGAAPAGCSTMTM
ncbi:MAG: hypothetical protein WKF79_05775 [Nocardioides sp.]